MMSITPDMKGMPRTGTRTSLTNDVDAPTIAPRELGGKVMVPPMGHPEHRPLRSCPIRQGASCLRSTRTCTDRAQKSRLALPPPGAPMLEAWASSTTEGPRRGRDGGTGDERSARDREGRRRRPPRARSTLRRGRRYRRAPFGEREEAETEKKEEDMTLRAPRREEGQGRGD